MRSIGSVRITALALVALLPLGCAGESGDEAAPDPAAEGMQARLNQFEPVTLGFDESLLDADQRRFHVERWYCRSSHAGWLHLAGPRSLLDLVERYAEHLGEESFYALF